MGTRRIAARRAGSPAIAFILTALALLVFPQPSPAEAEIGSPGSGAGQLSEPQAVAVDVSDDLLYVADTSNDRIAVFDATSRAFIKAFGWGVADGTTNALQVCTTTCFKGIGGTGAGQLDRAIGIAVDNEAASPGFHDVYVYEATATNLRVQKFTPAGQFVWMVGGKVNKTTEANLCTAASGNTCGAGLEGNGEGFFNLPGNGFGGVVTVGSGGTIHVADQLEGISPRPSRVQKFSAAGAHLGQQLLSVSGGAGKATGLRIDSAGNFFVGTSGAAGAVRKYSPAGTELFAVDPSFNVSAVELGPEGRLFVADNSASASKILEYNAATGSLVRVFYGSLEARSVGLSRYTTPEGGIFAAEQNTGSRPGRVLAIPFPAPGPIVYRNPGATVAGPIGNTKATVQAKINPEGEATTYIVEYISDENFKAAGDTFGAGTLKTTASASIGSDFELHTASTQLTGLFPETLYHYRFVATNASGTNIGPKAEFKTKEPVDFGEHWTTEVGTQSATLHAEANPLGIPSTARFQYVTQAEFDATGYDNAEEVPAPGDDPFDLGEGEAMKAVSAAIAGLADGTDYRYRLVVTNRCKPEPAPLCDFAEVEGTFTTFATLGPIAGCPNDQLRAEGTGQFLSDCRGYELVSPVDKNGANIEPLFNLLNFTANLDQAADNGDSISYSAYKAFADPESAPYTNQYLARRDTATGWQSEAISPVRTGPPLMTAGTAQLDRQYQAFSADLCDGWVLQDANPTLAPGAVAGFPGLYRRDNCGPGVGGYEALITAAPPNLPPRKVIPELLGTSTDGAVALFSLRDNLTPDAPPQPTACVDETEPSAEPCEPRLYEVRGGSLSLVCILPDDTPFTGGCSAGQTSGSDLLRGRVSNLGNALSEDGSRVFWTAAAGDSGPLYVRIDGTETVPVSLAASTSFWTAAADGSTAVYSVGQKLFEFDIDAEVETPIAEGFIGFAGASEDASRVYFASTKALTAEENSEGDKAVAGQPNLYLSEAGSGVRFVATLLSSDVAGFGSPVHTNVAARLSRVAPSGQQFVFMSGASITGYDNKDALTAERNLEVFYFDATAEGGDGVVLCPSCNPSNARSEGRVLTQKYLTSLRAAARIPVANSQLYGARVIAGNGSRVFFNSFEALTSRDVNGEEDVYQWEAPGTGSCTASSLTYHEASGGCVDLISTGQNPEGSEFVDSSADGEDVFFKTYQSLVNQDPHRLDIYDARVGGGFAGLPAPPIICQGEACQPPPKAPPVAVSPATRVPGPGNPVWPQPKPKPVKCPKGKHKVKAKNGKVRCVKNKKKHKRNKGRASQTGRAGR